MANLILFSPQKGKGQREGRIYRGSRTDLVEEAPDSDNTKTEKPVLCLEKIGSKLSSLSPKRMTRFLQNLASRDRVEAALETPYGRGLSLLRPSKRPFHSRSSSTNNRAQSASVLSLPTGRENYRAPGSSQTLCNNNLPMPPESKPPEISKSLSGRLGFGNHLSSGHHIRMRLPGDEPSRTQQMIASIDTQCQGLNLMRRDVWYDRLNEDGRGILEPVDDVTVRNLGSERIRVIGVVRGLEWYFKNGYRTYNSDFYIIDMDGFDVLFGSDTIHENQLLQPGPDLRYHLEKNATNERKYM
ncbi:hypothetical protein BDW59DRAFT_123693 [Aspergillus cavernicola]|uniref:Uncharacterized protein n=1 Tax=Aspergillus cavernicola TaxID=176166 RepID=A0ABR4IVB9_9EURO